MIDLVTSPFVRDTLERLVGVPPEEYNLYRGGLHGTPAFMKLAWGERDAAGDFRRDPGWRVGITRDLWDQELLDYVEEGDVLTEDTPYNIPLRPPRPHVGSKRGVMAHEFGHYTDIPRYGVQWGDEESPKIIRDEYQADDWGYAVQFLSATQTFTPKQTEGIWRELKERHPNVAAYSKELLANELYDAHPLRFIELEREQWQQER
jgi:hypothetical protein